MDDIYPAMNTTHSNHEERMTIAKMYLYLATIFSTLLILRYIFVKEPRRSYKYISGSNTPVSSCPGTPTKVSTSIRV